MPIIYINSYIYHITCIICDSFHGVLKNVSGIFGIGRGFGLNNLQQQYVDQRFELEIVLIQLKMPAYIPVTIQ